MIQGDDVVLVLSKSGESPEIKVLVPLIKNFGNRIIAIVGNTNSYLASEAHYCLNTTVTKEACPNNLAPTSSTTAQMVMGDALAVCLMQLKGFTRADFAKYHPGGNLGKRLYLQVQDLSKNNAKPSVTIDATLKEIIVVISKSLLGITAVINGSNEIIGIITDGDLRRMLANTDNLNTVTAIDIMNKNPKQINQHALAVNALELLREHDISQLIVVNNNEEYVGVLHLHDLIKEGIL
jgi:arabinose-5-phosphate isomerase